VPKTPKPTLTPFILAFSRNCSHPLSLCCYVSSARVWLPLFIQLEELHFIPLFLALESTLGAVVLVGLGVSVLG